MPGVERPTVPLTLGSNEASSDPSLFKRASRVRCAPPTFAKKPARRIFPSACTAKRWTDASTVVVNAGSREPLALNRATQNLPSENTRQRAAAIACPPLTASPRMPSRDVDSGRSTLPPEP